MLKIRKFQENINSAQKCREKNDDQRKFKKLWERIYFYNNYIILKLPLILFSGVVKRVKNDYYNSCVNFFSGHDFVKKICASVQNFLVLIIIYIHFLTKTKNIFLIKILIFFIKIIKKLSKKIIKIKNSKLLLLLLFIKSYFVASITIVFFLFKKSCCFYHNRVKNNYEKYTKVMQTTTFF
jgi:hypothetical protein